MEILDWLQKWFDENRAGHSEEGIQIRNTANTGWQVIIGLRHTYLDKQVMEPAGIQRSETDWFKARVSNNVFKAQCGARNLNEVLEAFREWAIENELLK